MRVHRPKPPNRLKARPPRKKAVGTDHGSVRWKRCRRRPRFQRRSPLPFRTPASRRSRRYLPPLTQSRRKAMRLRPNRRGKPLAGHRREGRVRSRPLYQSLRFHPKRPKRRRRSGATQAYPALAPGALDHRPRHRNGARTWQAGRASAGQVTRRRPFPARRSLGWSPRRCRQCRSSALRAEVQRQAGRRWQSPPRDDRSKGGYKDKHPASKSRARNARRGSIRIPPSPSSPPCATSSRSRRRRT